MRPVLFITRRVRTAVSTLVAVVLIVLGSPALLAQGVSSTGVPIKITAQAQAGVASPLTYYFAGRVAGYPSFFTIGGTNYTVCPAVWGYKHVEQGVTSYHRVDSYHAAFDSSPTLLAIVPTGELIYPWSATESLYWLPSDPGHTLVPYYRGEPGATSVKLAGTFLPDTPTAPLAPTEGVAVASTSNQVLSLSLGSSGIVRVEPGKTYTLSATMIRILGGLVNIAVPPQYRVVMNGLVRNSCPLAYSITFSVLPRQEPPLGAAGFASSVAASRLDWQVSLGSLRNGDSAGTLRMVESALSASWADFYTPGMLYYEPTSDEVFVHRENNVIRQIIANQVAVDVTPDGTNAYKISCYHPSQMAGAAPATFSGLPFAEYRIAKGSTATTLTFTKTTRNVTESNVLNPPVARVETMSLARANNWPNYTWTKIDWTRSGETALVTTTVESHGTATENGSVPARTETSTVQAPGGTAKVSVARTYAWGGAGEVLQRETLGTAVGNSPWTEFSYYTDIGQLNSFGYAKTVTLAGGQWEAYEYSDGGSGPSSFGGQIKTRFRPFGALPATAPTTPSLTEGEVTRFTYSADVFGALTRPASIQTQINGVTTAKTLITYDDTNPVFVVSTRKDYSDATNFLQTVTKSYSEKWSDTFRRNTPLWIVHPGAVKDAFVYQRGKWEAGVFTADVAPNTGSRIATIRGSATASAGTLYNVENGWGIEPIYLIDGKSTRSVTIRDANALVVRTESYAWKSSDWQLVSFTDITYNFFGLPVSRVSSNGATYTATYDGLLKMSETDESGVTTSYTYDVAGRICEQTRVGSGVIGSLTTRFTYDSAGNILEQCVGEVATGQLVTTKTSDDATRVLTEKPPGLGATTHTYSVSANTHTVTNPEGGQLIETKGIDGRATSKTGSATVSQFLTYGVEADGRQWSKVNTGTVASPRWQKTWKDWLGRQTRTERPSFTGQPNYAETKTYDPTTGRLTSSAATGVAPSLFVYDALGHVIRTGLDVTGNGTLDLASADRISDSDQTFEFIDNAWWARAETRQYAQVASATPTVMSVTRQRLTNFSPAGRVGETRSTDSNGNVTTVTTDVDRASGTAVTTTTTTGIATARLETKVAGLTISVRGHDNLTTRTGYDALLRPVTRLAPRNNTTTTAYQTGSSLVASITDATNTIVAQTTYDTMGRPIAQSGAPDAAVAGSPRHTTYTSYTLRGQPERQWGDAALPVSYTYDATYGDRLTLSTYRAGTGWSGATWPTATTGTADTTTWTYDAPSGLLVTKTDAVGAFVRYAYNSRGQLTRRTWARGVTTDYTYDSATAEQRDIDYGDGTPSLHYAYNRLAQTTQIEDATGSHLFTHCICGKLESERFDPFFYGNRLLTYSLNANSALGPLGRTTGFTLTTASAATEQSVAYGYDPTNTRARLTQVTAAVAGVAAASHSFNYAYAANSDLIELLSVDGGSTFAITRTFEAQRDVLTSINATWGSSAEASRARYDYVTDALGQRTSVKQNGSAFADYYDTGATNKGTFQTFAYDARGQLTANPAYLEDAAVETKKLPRRQHEFAYDNIGNRTSSNRTGTPVDADSYTANALNQYIARDYKRIPLSGTAKANANVVVAGPAMAPVLADRSGRYWAVDFTVPNGSVSTPGSQPWRGPLDLYFGQAAAGTAGADLVRLETRTAQIPARVHVMTYDADGNLTNDGIWSYTWDGENRLIQLTTVAAASTGYPQITLKFRYDYLGRRVEKLVIDSVSNRLISGRRFLYDGWNLLAEYSLNAQLSALTLVRSYTWGLDIARTMADAGGVGALLQIADHPSGKTYFPAYDGNGNIVALLNSTETTRIVNGVSTTYPAGSVAAAYEYSPFGEQLRADAPDSVVADQPFRFSTKYTDSETGLVYYGRRYYNPSQGRFVGRDSIEELGGRNLYGFCGNNGVNRWDMLGNLPSEVFALFGDNGFGNGWSNGNAPENFSTTDSAGRYWTLTPQWNEGSVMSYGLSFAEQNRRGGWDTTNVVAFNGDGHFMDASDFAYSANSAMYDPGFDWNTLFPDDPSTTGHLFGAGGLFGPKVPAGRVIIGTPIVVAAAGMVTTVPGILPNTTGGVSAVGSWLSRAGAWILTAADTTLLGPLGGILMLTPTKMGNGELQSPPFPSAGPIGPLVMDAKAPGVPTAGDGFVPKKNWDGKVVPSPNGGGYGYPDASGNVWVPTGAGPSAHGGPHWDVQQPGGGYRNVRPGGGG